jgi:hypothetical protein
MGQKANVGKIQKPILFEKWMVDAIQEIASTEGLTFTSVVLEFVRLELAEEGYTMGIGRESTKKKPESKIKTKRGA